MQMTCVLAALIAALGTEGPAEAPRGTIDTILQAWSQRAALVPGGEVHWAPTTEVANRFGRSEMEAVPRSHQDITAFTGSVYFDGQEARYDSTTFGFAPAPKPLFAPEKRMSDFEWQALDKFSDPHVAYRDPRPYSVLYQQSRRVHLWRGQGESYSGAVILSADPQPGELRLSQVTQDDGRLAEFHQMLLAPILLTYRPTLFEPRFLHPEMCHLAKEPLVYGGTPCQVLSVASETDGQQKASDVPQRHTYWIDPSRDFLVVRMVTTWGETVVSQLDIQYASLDGVGWIPHRWTVLQLGSQPDTIERALSLARTHHDFHTARDASRLAISLPAKSVVVDVPACRQYVIQSDQREESIPGPLGTFLRDPWVSAVATERGGTFWRKAHWVFATLRTWPGVLIPVGICSGFLILLNRLQARHQRATADLALPEAGPRLVVKETAAEGRKNMHQPIKPD